MGAGALAQAHLARPARRRRGRRSREHWPDRARWRGRRVQIHPGHRNHKANGFTFARLPPRLVGSAARAGF